MYLLIMLGLCLRRRQMTSVNMQSFSQLALLVVKVFLGSTTTPYWSTLWTRKRIIWRWTHRNLSSSTPLSYGLFMCAIQRLNGLRWSKSEVLTCMKHDIKTQEERGENETLSCYHRVKFRAGSVNRKCRLTDRKSQKPNRTETEIYTFSKTEPNRKPNSLTAVNRKETFLKFFR